MPHKDSSAYAQYMEAYYADPENKKASVERVRVWRKNNPDKLKTQSRRWRAAARKRAAQKKAARIAAALIAKATEAARAIIQDRAIRGYKGRLTPGGF